MSEIAFLLTDVEGSTSAFERNEALLIELTAQFDSICDKAVEACRGHRVKPRGEGDSHFCVFENSTDAVLGAVRYQQLLHEFPWPKDFALKVRMAIHVGNAQLREGDYYGRSVIRCARIRAVANGGQILLSTDAERRLQRDSLPGIEIISQGLHRLKDLLAAEELFMVRADAFPADERPLRSLSCIPNNLPTYPSSFIGRKAEVLKISELLDTARIVTLVGPGGVGKSRLAAHSAAECLPKFPDGVWMVPLAGLTAGDRVAAAIAQSAEDLTFSPDQPIRALADQIGNKQILFLVDNAEHLVDDVALAVEEIALSCPSVTLLVTSQEHLAIDGEHTLAVRPLERPLEGASFEEVLASGAAELLCDRLRQKGVEVDDLAEVAALGEICRRLDGIPLALELAAAQVPTMSISEIAAQLEHRFDMLSSGRRTALPRQQTLRAMVDWSYEPLSEVERRALQALTVFSGGWTRDAATSLLSSDGLSSVQASKALDRLVSRSLVTVEPSERGTRFSMLETIRHYAREKLWTDPLPERFARAHLEYFASYAARKSEQLLEGITPEVMRDYRLESENCQSAIDWGLSNPGSPGVLEIVLSIAANLTRFWYMAESSEVVQRILDKLPDNVLCDNVTAAAKLKNGAGLMLFRQGKYDSADAVWEECLPLWQQVSDERGVAAAHSNRGLCAFNQRRFSDALHLHEQALAIRKTLGDQKLLANSYNNIGITLMEMGDNAQARQYLLEAVTIRQGINDQFGVGEAMHNIALAERELGHREQAYETALRARELLEPFGPSLELARLYENLALISLELANLENASRNVEEAKQLQNRFSDQASLAHLAFLTGYIFLLQGKQLEAARSMSECAAHAELSESWIEVGRGRLGHWALTHEFVSDSDVSSILADLPEEPKQAVVNTWNALPKRKPVI